MRNQGAHRDAATWLHVAATPAFATMALWSAVTSDPMNMLCTHGMSSWNDMTLMYFLMAAFHAGPWLRVLAARRKWSSRKQGKASGVQG